MNTFSNSCRDCPSRILCHCLQVSEAEVIEALETRDIRTLKDLRRHTTAGDGCTACHQQLMEFLQEHRCPLPMCG
jgi:bacterioferritin-associated ferredoxin